MNLICLSCGAQILAEGVNVEKDVAFCAACHEAFPLSVLVESGSHFCQTDIPDPPRGVWFVARPDGWTIGSTTRSPIAFFLVPFMCVWSGFSLGGIYGSQIVQGRFDPVASIFGIPFILGTLLFGSFAVMSVSGKVVITLDRSHGRVFTGVGPLGWTRAFDWKTVDRVNEEPIPSDSSNTGKTISLVGKTRLNFGSMLADNRRYFIVQLLRRLLATRAAEQRNG